ncbi:ABC transporter substrate-binding protein [Goodfellowiella coeruleoviolacea]|uniref:Peptide/nickel transport system substrate-binding protein n=1 Tax=Goodfellowiella coeruleoviolacea TaxID=334858 RepID=A0AAE3KF20_9PSEU|nr:ABC transporter substrate-binding protein [Goodfellowiella coeruleoviolacea]MCP2164482.1 peptide/nickel transport system substrate-binding protein [Goodfellowiella coeruleoviolacea]
MVHSRTTQRRRAVILGLVGVVSLSLSACAQSQRGTDNSGSGAVGGTLTFGAAGAPKLFDPFYATDGETFRISRQIFEGLVGFKPGTAEAEPRLAERWEQSPDGKTWTFSLREGVKFHDGTDFNAEAVCFNFNRWYSQTGAGQSEAVSQYWTDNFGGFSDGAKPSLFKSCTVKDAKTAVVELTDTTSKFPDVLGLPSFSMQSPTALQKYDANNVQAQGDSFAFPEYATKYPTGTGPFKFVKYDTANNTVELERYNDYAGEKAKLDKLIFKIIPDETARKQALQSGDIDGYDFPAPADWAQLEKDGFNVAVRPAFNLFYVGLNQRNNAALRDLRVRQAIMYGIDREKLVKSQLPENAKVADEFLPDTVDGYTPDVQKYTYDPEKAKALLAEAGVSNLQLNCYWPSEVTRPYMPNPKDLYGAIAADLDKIGVKCNAVTKPWNGGYIEDLDQGKTDLFLFGWTGDYNVADNFLGQFFGSPTNRINTGASPWGQQLSDDLHAASIEPDKARRIEMYKDINKRIMSEYLPAVPISHSPPALVFNSKVKGVVPSPLTDEKFAPVSKG